MPSVARADVIWPAVIFEQHLLSVPPILLGLAVEIAVLKILFALQWRRAVLYGFVVNAISAVVGVVLIPAAGFLWELGPGALFGIATFDPVTWGATFILAILMTTAVEGICLIKIFKLRFGWKQWGFWFLANAASVAVAAYPIASADWRGPV